MFHCRRHVNLVRPAVAATLPRSRCCCSTASPSIFLLDLELALAHIFSHHQPCLRQVSAFGFFPSDCFPNPHPIPFTNVPHICANPNTSVYFAACTGLETLRPSDRQARPDLRLGWPPMGSKYLQFWPRTSRRKPKSKFI